MTNQEDLVKLVEAWHEQLPQAEIIPISATSKFNVDTVMKRIKELLPDSPPYFGKDQWTDKPARFFVTEIIREKILLYYDKEIPYSVEVVVEQFKEDAKSIHINAVIYVERGGDVRRAAVAVDPAVFGPDVFQVQPPQLVGLRYSARR